MIELFTDPAIWSALLTLTALEIVLGVDNVIFLSIATSKLPAEKRPRARFLGLTGALVLRILLLLLISWIISLQEPIATLAGWAFSWRDLILIAGGLFLIYKAATEIFDEVEGHDIDTAPERVLQATFTSVIVQIMLLDLVFSLDSVITTIGIADHVEVMIAAIIIAILIMMLAASPIAAFVEPHPSTKILALAFLFMVGMALIADGLHIHVERALIYSAMGFAGAVEALNLRRSKRHRAERE